jgi:transposase
MGRPAKYPEEFRREAVELFRSSERSRAEVAKSLGISDGSLGAWVKAVEATEVPGALDPDERAELARLRRENKDLRMDREILRKAALGSTGQLGAPPNERIARSRQPTTVGKVRSHVGITIRNRDHPSHAQNRFVGRPLIVGP